jgi:hypothetical protein
MYGEFKYLVGLKMKNTFCKMEDKGGILKKIYK